MLKADQGASPLDDCGWYRIKGQILMLEADQGPPLSIAFSSEAIKGLVNIDA